MKKTLVILLSFFAIVSLAVVLAQNWLTAKGVDIWVLLGGNLLLFAASIAALLFYASAMNSSKTYGAIRQVYSGFILKFFVLITGAICYFYFAKEVNKPAVFVCMGLYLFYNFMGTSQVVKKKKP